jgi:hypothetical protein
MSRLVSATLEDPKHYIFSGILALVPTVMMSRLIVKSPQPIVHRGMKFSFYLYWQPMKAILGRHPTFLWVDEECEAPALVAKGRKIRYGLKPTYAMLHIGLIRGKL